MTCAKTNGIAIKPAGPMILPRQESFASLHILTRRASEGSEALPSLARQGSYELLRCQGNSALARKSVLAGIFLLLLGQAAPESREEL